jgi:LPXTG-site transpeptidase (sortase) family protein
MRLRFGRPSLPLLIFFAALFGIAFYSYDNWDNEPVSAAMPVTAVTLPPNITSTPIPSPTPPPRTSIPGRQEIPQDTTLFIPTAGIFSYVVQAYLDGTSWDISQLRSNAGHLEGTPWVDQPGNVVISGHVELSTGQRGVFALLLDLEIGDVITVSSNEVDYTYIVSDIYSTQPNDLQPLMPTTTDRLTLITCNSYDFLSNTYQERIIVVADRVS